MAPNNYKKDDNKPPVLEAVMIPYRRALLAIAAMKRDMAERHKLRGAKNPFEEWKQLPEARSRLGNAGGRHILQPWDYNTADALPGTRGHLHIVHAITGLLMSLEKYLEEQEVSEVPDFADSPEQQATRECRHLGGLVAGRCIDCQAIIRADFLAERAAIELRLQGERQGSPLHGTFWTGDHGTWHCTCGAGRAEACTCDQSKGGTGIGL